MPLGGLDSWARYKVVALEYFLGYPDDPANPEAQTSYFKIVLYAERDR